MIIFLTKKLIEYSYMDYIRNTQNHTLQLYGCRMYKK